ncbi:hypothetical protein FOPG_14764 [Fusarium oxysporum f. sp. conglutinans race 2 54008]|uniref:LysM domain-containing protein n=3 Tax=Fusarium oxysporum f. sp. conglutinans TaxID=100902 RepID=A0A8H6LBQ3_FUSOX|nr:hypothetical protein FOXB_16406 [Fusarium oxysporum f. sp. conglutinans Fo5176]EXL69269.1 hypothetical protein FOPG_14764 [Fusarium oxysporum f. sp. conglutinans race 2 54008]KAF6514412.1 hypothetical protein HZS61_005546 [Fusarium oxysporum f. sp. conglutinans]KAG6978815.1 hypothetical protein FocnCong_v011141 [Fusarium oxysporum f. sp. conglutinans]KAI8400636.1 hypothetical protein FOFC_19484 [Fusarium oxysporum]
MVALQRLVPLLSLCLGTSAAFKIYRTEDLESYNVEDACVKALSADIACHEYIHSFMQPRYRGSLENVTLTDQICTGTCSASLRSWFNTVVVACADEDFGGGVPQRYGGYIWNGWNETCVKDPKTKKYCNDIIDEFTELKDGEEMPLDELCHICYRRRLAIMQSSSYSIYDHFYQSQLEKVYKTCGGSGPTEIPPPPKVEKPEEYCLTNKYYTTKEGDTCDSIARANPGVAGVYLYMGNQELIGDCRDLPAGLKLCLPTTCPIYVVKPGDTCWSIERSLKVIEDTVEDYNSWINVDCTNLQKATDFYGKPICIGPFGAGSRSASSDAVAKTPLRFSSANGPEVVLMEPPEKAEVADGTTLKCGLWHVIKEGESCADICKAHEICKEDVMYEVNPTLSRNNDECTKSLVPGEALCVAPIAGWNTTYESTGPAQEL